MKTNIFKNASAGKYAETRVRSGQSEGVFQKLKDGYKGDGHTETIFGVSFFSLFEHPKGNAHRSNRGGGSDILPP